MTDYVDAGWSGTPDAITAALATYGYNTDGTQADPSKAGPVAALANYRELDGVGYILVRSTAPPPLPAGITEIGPQLTAVICGVFL